MKRKTILLIAVFLILAANFAFVGPSIIKTLPITGLLASAKSAKKKGPLVGANKVAEVKQFISKNKYNDKVCFIINMDLPSGSNRFFVYDLKKDSVTNAGVVTHGRCNQLWMQGRKYSNVVGSGCTSLGKYKVGKPYYGKFGLAYKLHGLESSNDNAFERYVVLHSHECVPDKEVAGEICQSDGCPTVSPAFLKKLQKIIDSSEKPVLMLIYD